MREKKYRYIKCQMGYIGKDLKSTTGEELARGKMIKKVDERIAGTTTGRGNGLIKLLVKQLVNHIWAVNSSASTSVSMVTHRTLGLFPSMV